MTPICFRRYRDTRQFHSAWDDAARDVRAAIAAATAEHVDRETAGLDEQRRREVTARIWGEITDLMYPTTPKEH